MARRQEAKRRQAPGAQWMGDTALEAAPCQGAVSYTHLDVYKRQPRQGAPSFDDAKLGREKPLAQGGPDPEKEDRVMLVLSLIHI